MGERDQYFVPQYNCSIFFTLGNCPLCSPPPPVMALGGTCENGDKEGAIDIKGNEEASHVPFYRFSQLMSSFHGAE